MVNKLWYIQTWNITQGEKNEWTIGTYKKGIYYELKKNSLKKLHIV